MARTWCFERVLVHVETDRPLGRAKVESERWPANRRRRNEGGARAEECDMRALSPAGYSMKRGSAYHISSSSVPMWA